MKTHLVLLLALMSNLMIAQIEWRGGFPGQETNWFCADNWSDNRIPDDFDNVIVPDCSTRGNYYPVIRRQEARVQSIQLHSGARVTIQVDAKLTVFGFGLPGGALLNLGMLENHGTLEVIEPVLHVLKYSGKGILIHRLSGPMSR